jgi:hypothetical protein
LYPIGGVAVCLMVLLLFRINFARVILIHVYFGWGYAKPGVSSISMAVNCSV